MTVTIVEETRPVTCRAAITGGVDTHADTHVAAALDPVGGLLGARRSAAGERTRTINQARSLLLTGPDDLRARFTRHTPAALVTGLAALRPRPGDVAGYAVRVALRELGRRARFLGGQLERLD